MCGKLSVWMYDDLYICSVYTLYILVTGHATDLDDQLGEDDRYKYYYLEFEFNAF